MIGLFFVLGCSASTVDGGVDGAIDLGIDSETSDARVDDAPADAEDVTIDAASCAAAPAMVPCAGLYALRGMPLDVTGWRTNLGVGTAHDPIDGWRWIGFVRDPLRPARFSEYRIVHADDHLTSLDTTTVVRALPRDIGGSEYQLRDFLYDRCRSEWLALLFNDATPGTIYGVGYDLAGNPISGPTDLSILNSTVGYAARADGYGFIASTSSDVCGPRMLSTAWVDARDLSVTQSAGVAFDDRYAPHSETRGSDWVLASHATCDQTSSLMLWDVASTGEVRSPRTVTGLVDVGRSSWWNVKVFEDGPAIAWALRLGAPGSIQMLATGVDVVSGNTRTPPTVVVDGTDLADIRPGLFEQEGDAGFAILYAEDTLSAPPTQRTWFVRIATDGTVLQRTMIAENPTVGGLGPFALKWLRDRYIVGYRHGPDVLDELRCSP